ncbi:MAG: methyl-accepting chemotaxis protein [Syntrophales bacterium]|nr:methyl-accepting chemotaxis protein [Syntrophales bacterium]
MKNFFNNLKLAKKMLLAPFVVFIFMLMIAAGTYQAISSLSGSIDDIYNNRFKGYQNSSQVLVDLSTVQSRLYKIMNWISSNYDKQRIEELVKQTDALLASDVELMKKILNSKNLTADEKKYYQVAFDNLVEFQKQAKSALDIAVQDASTAVMAFGMAEDKFEVLDKSLRELNVLEDKLSKERYSSSVKTANTALTAFLIFMVAAIIISFLISVSITRFIVKPIRETIHVLKQLAEGDLTQHIDMDANDEIGELVKSVNIMRSKMNDAVGQALEVSAVLSDSASREAASIEETSASLDEIASMTRQNATNTGEANNLMITAKGAIKKANESMVGLTTSMKEIAMASEQTQKIVKSIDEIAFQTNLLALNASVEAARAGEAGAGFAVVADEVRNLAMRAKQSAQDSSTLMEDIVHKVRSGENLVNVTSTAFGQVTSSSDKVVELMSEIAAASQEQSQGIDQVNSAIAEMNITTQQNAGNAETLSNIMSMFKTEHSSEASEGESNEGVSGDASHNRPELAWAQ